MNFGDRVNISHKLVREYTHTRRTWRSTAFAGKDCIFLGYRTLREHIVHYHDDGIQFEAKPFKKAALVAVNHLTNPIYVPLGAINES